MQIHVEKNQDQVSSDQSSAAKASTGQEHTSAPGPADDRPEALQMSRLQELAGNSRPNQQLAQLQKLAAGHASGHYSTQMEKNNTGLPDRLKAGVENLSGHSLDDVKVHYNSDRPAQLQAHAYAQGTDIHIAPGQERHLPHEAWHVVQQKQGRVKPTRQMKGMVNVNDDAGLEKEADEMGERAMQLEKHDTPDRLHSPTALSPVAQLATYTDAAENKYETENFDGGRERPVTVSGKVRNLGTAGRGGAPAAIARINPATHDTDPMPGYDGGHVLGLALGGTDRNYNVVPMLPKFNRDVWLAVENDLISRAVWVHSGDNFKVVITLAYTGTNKAPDSLTVTGYADEYTKDKDKSKRKKTGKQRQVYTVTKSQPDDIEETPAPGNQEADLLTGANPDLNSIKTDITNMADHPVNPLLQHLGQHGTMPVAPDLAYPDRPADRPYGHLDVLVFAGKLDPGTNFGNGWEFSQNQRTLILKANMARNGGNLRSDDPLDAHQNLSERGAANFPEVDHIIPKSSGGSNLFSNARLVSWQLNNRDDRVKDITSLVDPARISYPAVTGATQANIASSEMFIKIWTHKNKKASTFTLADVAFAFALQYNIHTNVQKYLSDRLNKLVTDNYLQVDSGNYSLV